MKRIADYEIISELGRGNHGRFFLAEAPARLGRGEEQVAVKVLDHHATDKEFRRIGNELRVYASVQSPNVVEIIDAGYDGGAPFYAMPYYASGSLARPTEELDEAGVVQANRRRGSRRARPPRSRRRP